MNTESTGPSAVWVNTPDPDELLDGVTHHTFYKDSYVCNL